MRNFNSSPTVTNCTFSGNGATNGGGMYNEGDSPAVTNCTFTGNFATYGAGMYNLNSNPTVTNCTIIRNDATFGGGGGMYSENSNPTLTNCTFVANSVALAYNASGGGMYNFASSPTVTNCTFVGNRTLDIGGRCPPYNGRGGGMYNAENSNPTVPNCTFNQNRAMGFFRGVGGGMYNVNSSPTLTNCAFTGNSAFGSEGKLGISFGGGMANSNGSSPIVANCTFIANRALSGNIFYDTGSGGGIAGDGLVSNCILWGNSDDGGTDESAQIHGDAPVVNYCCIQGLTGALRGTGNIGTDPLFVNGPSGTWTEAGNTNWGDGQTIFTDSNASFAPNELVGKFIDPDTGLPFSRDMLIAANTATTITVWGIYSYVEPGDSYQVHDYHLPPGSPCIDAGNNWGVPIDANDYDEDGVLCELFPVDLDGNPRFNADELDFDPGCGVPVVVDMGAYEYQFDPADQVTFADLNGDDAVGVVDLLGLLGSWGPCAKGCCLADLDLDGNVGVSDLLALLVNWGPCP